MKCHLGNHGEAFVITVNILQGDHVINHNTSLETEMLFSGFLIQGFWLNYIFIYLP